MRKIFSVLMLSLVLFASCKKDGANTSQLKGTWYAETETERYYVNNQLDYEDEFQDPDLTLVFKDNNVVEISVDGLTVEGTYNSNSISYAGETAEIRNFTSTSFTLYQKETIDAGEYYEYTFAMKKQ